MTDEEMECEGLAKQAWWDGEHYICHHSSGMEMGCPGCLDGSLHRARRALGETTVERDEARGAAQEIYEASYNSYHPDLEKFIKRYPWLNRVRG